MNKLKYILLWFIGFGIWIIMFFLYSCKKMWNRLHGIKAEYYAFPHEIIDK